MGSIERRTRPGYRPGSAFKRSRRVQQLGNKFQGRGARWPAEGERGGRALYSIVSIRGGRIGAVADAHDDDTRTALQPGHHGRARGPGAEGRGRRRTDRRGDHRGCQAGRQEVPQRDRPDLGCEERPRPGRVPPAAQAAGQYLLQAHGRRRIYQLRGAAMDPPLRQTGSHRRRSHAWRSRRSPAARRQTRLQVRGFQGAPENPRRPLGTRRGVSVRSDPQVRQRRAEWIQGDVR